MLVDALPGVEVDVRVGGQKIDEHIDADVPDKSDRCTRYIASITGAEFHVECKITQNTTCEDDGLGCSIWVDDIQITGKFVPARSFASGTFSIHLDGRYGMQGVQRLAFAPLEIVEGLGGTVETNALNTLGTIKVEVHHYTEVEEVSHKSMPITKDVGTLSEKKMKGDALSHAVKLKEVEPTGSRRMVRTRIVPGHEKPIVFKYRSEASLKAMMVIPRSPSPIPLEDQDPEGLNADDRLELIRRLKAKLSSSAPIKIEDEEESNTRHRKRSRQITPEVVEVEALPPKHRTPAPIPEAIEEVILIY